MVKILAIDDNKNNLITIKALLEDLLPECEIFTAQSGAEGINITKEKLPDVILLDIIMPIMDGFDVCKQLKTDKVLKHIPVILITAIKADTESRVKGLESGADAFFTKPIEPSELYAQVNAMLRIKKAEDILRNQKKDIEETLNNRTKKLQETELKIIEREKELRLIAESSIDTIFEVTKTGKILFVSRFNKDVFGYGPEDIIGTSLTNYIPKKELPVCLKILKDVFLRKKVKNFETYLKSRNGHLIPVEINGQLIKKDGKYIGLGMIRDITERKLAKEIMNTNLQNQRLLTNVSFLFTKTENIENNINNALRLIGEYINASRVYIFKDFDDGKYTKNIHEWCNKNIKPQIDNLQAVPYKMIPSFKKSLTEKGEILSNDISGLSQDMIDILKPQKIKSILIFPIYIQNNFFGFMGFDECEKIRTWKETEVELLKTLVNITSNLFKRRKIEEDLKQALIKAEESDRLKSAFLATMSHELRTPLNTTIGFSDIIANTELSKNEIKDFANDIFSAGHDLLHIVEDIFDITLIETEEVKIIEEKFHLNKTLKDIQDIFSNNDKILNNKINLILNKKLEDGKDIIYTDETKLNKILKILLENAFKFTHQGTIEFGYTVKNYKDNSYLQFYVRDTGIGISKDKQSIIFERFRQVDDSFTRKYGGIGLGLYISKKLVEMLGGKIWVKSENGNGSNFCFTIPLNKIKKTSDIETIQTNIAKPDWKGKTILVVEDDTTNYKYIQILLLRNNAKLLWARNGREAIKLFELNSEISLVLIDIQLLDINGYELTKKIKKLKKHIPVIAQTAYALAGDKEKSYEAGCDYYFSKPLKANKFIEVIDRFI